MKRSKSEIDLNQLLQDLPESTQQVIRGGTFVGCVGTSGYIKIKKLNSGG